MNERGLTRPAAIGLIVAGGAVIAAGFWEKSQTAIDPQAENAAAQGAQQRTEQAVEALGRAVEPRAAQAAAIRQLGAGLESGVDARTFQDLFETEDWWNDSRKETYSALVAGDQILATTGLDKLDVAGSPIVARARENKVASGIVRGPGRTYVVAAALVPRASDRKPVVVIGELLDEAHLQHLADRTGDALGLSDGQKLYDTAGPPERRHALQALVGREAQGTVLLEEGLLGVPVVVAPKLWLWAVAPAPAKTGGSGQKPILLWALGAAVLGIGIGVMGRRRPVSRTRNDHQAPARTKRTLYVGTVPDTQEGHAASAPESAPAASRPASPAPAPLPATVALASVPRLGSQNAALAATAVAPTTSETMGRYTLIERIGEGGMAEIFTASAHGAEGFERRFVIKRLHAHLARRKEAVSQFIDEARLQAQLVHSNIVPVFDFGRVGEEYFLALEYIHGRDLEKLLQRHIQVFNQALDLRVVGYIIHEVLEALAYAHSKRDQSGRPLEIVHRDISPANILISYQGEVKLTDFGIVKAGQRVSQTEMGMVKGNAAFMSPEQARGTSVDSRSDLFSAGVVMFCCLSGQALYKGETTLNQLVRAAVGPATSQFQAIETLPEQSVPVLSRALMLEPSQRFQTAAEFARELAPLVPGMKAELARLMEQLFPENKRLTT